MLLDNVLKKIESLPPLPKTVMEIEEFRKKEHKEIGDLLKIVEKDALIVSSLLKIANSAMFGFRSRVETPLRAISLLGINFTVSVAISGSVQHLFKSDLESYGISINDFMKSSNCASILASLWLKNLDYDLKEEIVLPALLQDMGKFIISDYVKKEGLLDTFRQKIEEEESIEAVEREMLGATTSQVTAKIFKHWKLSEKLIEMIENIDNAMTTTSEFKHQIEILDVIKTATYIKDPLNARYVNNAIKTATKYKLDVKGLKEAIIILKNRIDNL